MGGLFELVLILAIVIMIVRSMGVGSKERESGTVDMTGETRSARNGKQHGLSCGCLMLIGIMLIALSYVLQLPWYMPQLRRAYYLADGVPVIGDIRTKVELFRYEHDHLPGVPTLDGKVVTNDCGYATSALRADDRSAVADGGNAVQTMVVDDSSGKVNYLCGGCVLTNESEMANHVWRQTDISSNDLTGSKLQPNQVQYAAIMSSSNAYYWVVGCFGDGRGLSAGTGYVVAEFNDQANKRMLVAQFENYKPIASVPLSIHVGPMEQEGGPTTDRETMLKAGKVFLPTAEMLLNDYDNAIKAMREFGWQMMK